MASEIECQNSLMTVYQLPLCKDILRNPKISFWTRNNIFITS